MLENQDGLDGAAFDLPCEDAALLLKQGGPLASSLGYTLDKASLIKVDVSELLVGGRSAPPRADRSSRSWGGDRGRSRGGGGYSSGGYDRRDRGGDRGGFRSDRGSGGGGGRDRSFSSERSGGGGGWGSRDRDGGRGGGFKSTRGGGGGGGGGGWGDDMFYDSGANYFDAGAGPRGGAGARRSQ